MTVVQIGPLQSDLPRAVMVREPENLQSIHSAVSARIHVLTDTKTETDAILASWPVIMQAAADKIEEILSALKAQSGEGVQDGPAPSPE